MASGETLEENTPQKMCHAPPPRLNAEILTPKGPPRGGPRTWQWHQAQGGSRPGIDHFSNFLGEKGRRDLGAPESGGGVLSSLSQRPLTE